MTWCVWSDEEVKALKELWKLGWSASKISDELNRLFGSYRLGRKFTRNGVLGKLFRGDAPKRKTVVSRPLGGVRPGHQRQKLTKMFYENVPVKPETVKLRVVSKDEPTSRKSLYDLNRNECRYPYGEGDYLFCGSPTDDGVSWCPYHLKLVSSPPVSRIRAPIYR